MRRTNGRFVDMINNCRGGLPCPPMTKNAPFANNELALANQRRMRES